MRCFKNIRVYIKIKVEQNLYLSTSIGIKEYSGENINDFVKELDRAMYRAKKPAKNHG